MAASGSDNKAGVLSTDAKLTAMLRELSAASTESGLTTGQSTPGLPVPNNTPASSVHALPENVAGVAARAILNQPRTPLKRSTSAPTFTTPKDEAASAPAVFRRLGK